MSQNILVNEIGYLPMDPKRAVYRGEGTMEFSVIDRKTGEKVYEGVTGREIICSAAEEKNRIISFDGVVEEGEYIIKAGGEESVPFVIKEWVYSDAMKALLKFFYLQRCGQKLPEEIAGEFAHEPCHDTNARIYGTDRFIDVSGGWHDAGDFGRYIVPAAVTIGHLFLAMELDPNLIKFDFGIPVENPDLGQLLSEIKYETDWMLKMQDTESGEVYHKVSCTHFCDFFMPEEEKDELVISPVSYAATLDFAASLAMAVRFFKPVDAEYADILADASKKAYEAAKKMEVKGFHNPEGIVTGEYGDESLEDELYWASAELYRTFGEEEYRKTFEEMAYKHISHGYGWEDVYSFGNVAYILSEFPVDETLKSIIIAAIDAKADSLLYLCKSNGYNISFNEKSFIWGSNMYLMQNAFHLYTAYFFTKKDDYLEAAKEHTHYILGKNPCNVCFLTGFGTNRVLNPHHRPSAAKKKPMPGMVVGGPDSGLHDPTAEKYLKGQPSAKCYVDELLSYSTNEITLYWNSAMVVMLALFVEGYRELK
ncbi:MAG: glycoside hydrolase family 9 protein [Lachnospiraceae bacterium]|nr:glycoside hydrolase family 9 protein [Lachnospiraceae bacterium]